MPLQGDLEALGVHVGVVALRRRGAEYIRDGRTGDDHVDGLPQVDVGREGEPAVEESGVETGVIGRGGLPGQVLGQSGRAAHIALLDAVEEIAGGGGAHRLLVLVVAQAVRVTERTVGNAELEVGDRGGADVPPGFLGDSPTGGD